MKKMTEQNLINAYGGESQAHIRYLRFADQAERDHYPNIARLFRAIAHAEWVHAGDHFHELRHLEGGFTASSMAVFGPGTTRKNLRLAVMGEDYEITEMYPAYIAVAKFQGEPDAQRSFEWSVGSEFKHKQLFQKALEAVEASHDLQLGPLWVCRVCGYTVEGDQPDSCSLCNALKDQFVSFV